MPNEKPPKLSNRIALLGWVIAVLSLILNYLIYQQTQSQIEAQQKKEPKYEVKLSTYDPINLPKNILIIKEPVRHEFKVDHKAGKSVERLALNFSSPDKKIIDIIFISGKTDVTKNITKKEAIVIKPVLLPDTTLNGYVITDGITKLGMAVGAGVGTEYQPYRGAPSSVFDDLFGGEPEAILIVGIIFFVLVVSIFLFIKAISRFKRSESFGLFRTKQDNLPLLVLILFLVVFPSRFLGLTFYPGAILDGLVLYFVLTRYKLIIDALKALADRNDILTCHCTRPLKNSGC